MEGPGPLGVSRALLHGGRVKDQRWRFCAIPASLYSLPGHTESFVYQAERTPTLYTSYDTLLLEASYGHTQYPDGLAGDLASSDLSFPNAGYIPNTTTSVPIMEIPTRPTFG